MHFGGRLGDIRGVESSGQNHALIGMGRHELCRQIPIDGMPAPPVGSRNGGIEKEPWGFKSEGRCQIQLQADAQGLDPLRETSPRCGAEPGRLIPVELDRVEASRPAKGGKQCLVGIHHDGDEGHIGIVGLQFHDPGEIAVGWNRAGRGRIEIETEGACTRLDAAQRILGSGDPADLRRRRRMIEKGKKHRITHRDKGDEQDCLNVGRVISSLLSPSSL